MNCAIFAAATVREASRRKLIILAGLVGLAFLLLYGLAFRLGANDARAPASAASRLIERQGEAIFTLLGLYAANLLTATIAILAAIDALSGDIASGAMQTIISKPLPRWQLFVGKWLGLAALLTLFQVLLLGGVLTIAGLFAGFLPPHPLQGAALLWLEMVLLLSVTLLWGTRLSTLANGVLSLGLFGMAFLGGWIEQIGAITHHPRAVTIGIAASLAMPSEALWRRASFLMQSPLAGALGLGPFTNASVPSRLMVAYAACYLAAALALALRSFHLRDL
ncbi:MAG: hypothetical protein ACRD1E_09420 [Terriglobales bacterium]